jgi:hypothetical protein
MNGFLHFDIFGTVGQTKNQNNPCCGTMDKINMVMRLRYFSHVTTVFCLRYQDYKRATVKSYIEIIIVQLRFKFRVNY